jgi:S1-C subfamily serine protease
MESIKNFIYMKKMKAARLVLFLNSMIPFYLQGQEPCRILSGVPDWGQVVGILYRDSLARDSVGTAFVIARRNFVMTCAHEVGESKVLYFEPMKSRAAYRMTLKVIDSSADLALLETADSITNFPPLEFAPSFRVASGDSVFYICYNPATRSCCIHFTTIYSESKGINVEGIDRCIQYFGEIIPGNSGGPVLNSNGEVIGIIKGRISTESAVLGLESKKGCAFPVLSFEDYLRK